MTERDPGWCSGWAYCLPPQGSGFWYIRSKNQIPVISAAAAAAAAATAGKETEVILFPLMWQNRTNNPWSPWTRLHLCGHFNFKTSYQNITAATPAAVVTAVPSDLIIELRIKPCLLWLKTCKIRRCGLWTQPRRHACQTCACVHGGCDCSPHAVSWFAYTLWPSVCVFVWFGLMCMFSFIWVTIPLWSLD